MALHYPVSRAGVTRVTLAGTRPPGTAGRNSPSEKDLPMRFFEVPGNTLGSLADTRNPLPRPAFTAPPGPIRGLSTPPGKAESGPIRATRVTRKGDPSSRAQSAAGLPVWRMVAVVPGVLLVERACSSWLPAAGARLGDALPAWGANALAGAIVLAIALAVRAVSREEVRA